MNDDNMNIIIILYNHNIINSVINNFNSIILEKLDISETINILKFLLEYKFYNYTDIFINKIMTLSNNWNIKQLNDIIEKLDYEEINDSNNILVDYVISNPLNCEEIHNLRNHIDNLILQEEYQLLINKKVNNYNLLENICYYSKIDLNDLSDLCEYKKYDELIVIKKIEETRRVEWIDIKMASFTWFMVNRIDAGIYGTGSNITAMKKFNNIIKIIKDSKSYKDSYANIKLYMVPTLIHIKKVKTSHLYIPFLNFENKKYVDLLITYELFTENKMRRMYKNFDKIYFTNVLTLNNKSKIDSMDETINNKNYHDNNPQIFMTGHIYSTLFLNKGYYDYDCNEF